MALFLDELYIERKNFRANVKVLYDAILSDKFPAGVSRVAGPWHSSEAATIYLVLDVENLDNTFSSFFDAIAGDVLTGRRLIPIVDSAQVERLLNDAPAARQPAQEAN